MGPAILRRVRQSLVVLAGLADTDLRRVAGQGSVQSHLYAALRREQAAFVASIRPENEPSAILAFARAALEELEMLLAGRPDPILDEARDGEWCLRDLLRHAIAVELRYRAQVLYSARRREDEPIAIPDALLPCDRISPPDAEYGETRTSSLARTLELLRGARTASDAVLRDIGPNVLTRPSIWGRVTIDVRERLHQVGAHLVEVIAQTEKMLGTREPEARRIMRRVRAVRGMHQALTEPAALARLDRELDDLASLATSAG